MIGKHYIKGKYDCAHFVAEWYREKLNITVPTDDVGGFSFVSWIRRHFSPVNDRPRENDLVIMTNIDGSFHIGVYSGRYVIHNYAGGDSEKGSSCKWKLSAIYSYYAKVRIMRWSK